MQTRIKPIGRNSVFNRRFVISLPPWAVFPMAGAIAFGLLDKPLLVTNVVAIIIIALALVLILVARREVRKLRYDIHHALNHINSDELDDDDDVIVPLVTHIKPRRESGTRLSG